MKQTKFEKRLEMKEQLLNWKKAKTIFSKQLGRYYILIVKYETNKS